jgi:hypothetical protein
MSSIYKTEIDSGLNPAKYSGFICVQMQRGFYPAKISIILAAAALRGGHLSRLAAKFDKV